MSEIWVRRNKKSSKIKRKECKSKFITEVIYKKEFKEKAIKIFYEGNSGRAVGRIMGINKSTGVLFLLH